MMHDDTFILVLLILTSMAYFISGILTDQDFKNTMARMNKQVENLNVVGKIILVPLLILNFIRAIGTKMPKFVDKIVHKLLRKR